MDACVYPDGTRDRPACLAEETAHPNRVRNPDPAALCPVHERRAHADTLAGLAEMQPYLRRRLAFTDFLIEHGRNPL